MDYIITLVLAATGFLGSVCSILSFALDRLIKFRPRERSVNRGHPVRRRR